MAPWEGREYNLPAGHTVRWELDFDRIRLSDRGPQPKAGDTVEVRFWLPLTGDAAKRVAATARPAPGQPPAIRSNTLAFTLKDAPPGPPPGKAELTGKWDESMELVYRQHDALRGYRAVQVDGEGRLKVVRVGQPARGPWPAGPALFERKADRKRLTGWRRPCGRRRCGP